MLSEVIHPFDFPRLVTVYRATNTVNHDFYIGVTSKHLNDRKWQHFTHAKQNSCLKFHRAIRKHGKENFDFEVMWYCHNYRQALESERDLIRILHPQYNLTAGGGGVLGYRFSEDSKKKMSLAKLGKPSHHRGKSLPQEMKDKISKTLRDKPVTKEWLESVNKASAARRKPVICLNDGKYFSSATEAAKYYGLVPSVVSTVARGRLKSLHGYKFMWSDKK